MEKRNMVHGFYFDTINYIDACAPKELLNEAMQLCDSYNKLLSKSIETSDIWRINHAEGKSIRVNAHTAAILKAGAEIYRASGGAFNMTIGAVSSLWNFKAEKPQLPRPEDIEAALKLCDQSLLEIDGDEVRLPAGMQIDVGGIAKGYIADRVGEFLRENGVESAMLNFGGNVIAIGPRPDGEPWMVGLQRPGGEINRDFWAAVPVQDLTLVTSGTYERGFTLNGKRYHHLLDPRTGYSVDNEVLTVTLLGDESLMADGLSTACFVLGPQQGARLAHAFGMRVIYLLKDGRIHMTPGIPLNIVKQK